MTLKLIKLLVTIAFACAFSACSTPQPALDQANNGAALTLSLQEQMAALHSTQSLIARSRIASIRRQNARVLEYKVASAFDDRVQLAAGGKSEARLETDLRALADSLARDRVELASSLALLDANMASLLESVPVQDAQLVATQNAMGALGQELSLEHRARVIADFAMTVKKTIDDNKEKSDAAVISAPTADAQAQPGSSTGTVN
jgi:hypothetical protein